ncbi:DUF1289 domain-containing protein [Gammaproteobacteria bacterium]|nr:DUF1289 domain-containing protein [Gammaproteobacteria bacterium]
MTSESQVISPCSSICSLNEDDICIGCYRTGSEIRDWRHMLSSQKSEVLRLCNERSQENDPLQ